MLAGGTVIRRGICGSVLVATVAGGPPNRPMPGAGGGGGGPAGAVSCETVTGPPGLHACQRQVALLRRLGRD